MREAKSSFIGWRNEYGDTGMMKLSIKLEKQLSKASGLLGKEDDYFTLRKFR